MSALLGRMPSAVGYQPTLLTEMGELQERITSTKKGSITSVQAIYVPADDYTDPAPGDDLRASGRDDEPVARRSPELGIYPAVDPLASTSRILDPRIIGDGALRRRAAGEADSPALQGSAGHHRDSRHRRAVGRRQADACHARARSRSSCRSRSSSPSSSPGSKGKYVTDRRHHPRLQGNRRRQARRDPGTGFLPGWRPSKRSSSGAKKRQAA